MEIELKQVLSQVIAFLVVLWILKKFTWQPLLDLLEARTKKIEASFEEADEKNREAEAFKAQYEEKISHLKDEGQQIIQSAVKEARVIAAEIQADSQKNADEIVKKAYEQAQRDLSKARAELQKESVETGCLIFEKLVHQKLSKEERENLSLEMMKGAL